MTNQVIVTAHPETKEVITQSSNPEWSRVRVESKELTVSNGIMQVQKRSALVSLRTADADAMSGILKAGQPYPIQGKIVVKESTTPFWEGQSPKINPQTNEVLVDADGNTIYRTTEFTTDLSASDELVAHATAAQEAAEADIKAEIGQEPLNEETAGVTKETVAEALV